VGLVQARPNRRSDVWCLAFRARARERVQQAEHAAQAVQNPAALGAFPGVTLEAHACPRSKLLVEVRGHVVWGPPVVALEPRAMQNVAHS
jgi:hypothetical protein